MTIVDSVRQPIEASIAVKQRMLADNELLEGIVKVGELFSACFARGGKVLIAGNGGSAADAQHIAAEFVGRFKHERRGLPAIALTTDTSILTAVANDYGYAKVFRRQVEALSRPGDVLVAISTSGESGSILEAVSAAKEFGVLTVGLTGAGGGRLAKMCDQPLRVQSTETARIQEAHILIGHILCELVDHSAAGPETRDAE